MNTYGYVSGNGLNRIDPLGLYSFTEFRHEVMNLTGGCSNYTFEDDVINNFISTNDEIGFFRFGLSATFGGSFAKTYGGLTPLKALINGVGFRSGKQAIATISGTSTINSLLIGGMFQVGNFIGSIIRTGVNRLNYSICGCEKNENK